MKVFKLLTPKERVEFIANMLKSQDESTLTWYLRIRGKSKNLLRGAFGWSRTPQGMDYWEKINFFIHNNESI